jgi:hypothetical protein
MKASKSIEQIREYTIERPTMDDFLSVEACMPNLNTATIAGKVIKVEELKGKSVGLAFVVGFQKHWPSGTQEIPIRCYVTGAERLEKLRWLKMGETVLVHGEVTDKGAVYAMQIEQLSKADRDLSEADAYLRGMSQTSKK